MPENAKDVPNGELVPAQSELQLADIRIRELEKQLAAAQEEIKRLKAQVASARS